jgi:hypothetical protein
MRVTEVRIRKVNQDGNRMKAVCSVTFDDEFVVHDIKVSMIMRHKQLMPYMRWNVLKTVLTVRSALLCCLPKTGRGGGLPEGQMI